MLKELSEPNFNNGVSKQFEIRKAIIKLFVSVKHNNILFFNLLATIIGH